ncbi:ferric reductase-like transmembrane domain-containing protein [Herbaspirillum sp. RTI4]|uniref:ferredoxin reductase family protein n=1 Tax=Herbaspirillum sp. RTI4 TaxID=3048640 RepID=UPI002AB36AFB|nr:ferric reductase-like transmembrane domain-containing protein [Herbaspirillum sp. RTI4]MDY7577292.1 ferric reductase-like transmembrane domain-containing protein [Herbaspirillum sp. RTI4]MEA9982942.1 ferric reductase-like transmembrane domain-containing protein [Herbaspirillum sp. RTI4]
MKQIKLSLWFFLLALSGLWLLADTLMPTPFTYFTFRKVLVQFTGVIAIGAMSVAMMLAIRPKWLERHLDGLDKMYRLHKWLGMTALIAGVTHWWWVTGTKWMVGWGWLIRPARKLKTEQSFGVIELWLRTQRGTAEFLGEWVFYAAVVLIALALIKQFPYHLFTKTHQWMAAIYAVLVYHAVILIKMDYWRQPVGWALAVLMLGGSWAAVLALSGRIGNRRRTSGKIESLLYYSELRMLEVSILLAEGWAGHAAGQFAFVTSNKREGAHPYTIASSWNAQDRRVVFIAKALGDHTSRLHNNLKVGMPVTVEGPYGCFDFCDQRPRQIWIGAGIGITPFIARMKQLAHMPVAQEIDLFHPTAEVDQAMLDKLMAYAQEAHVRLHVLVTGTDGRLDGARIRAAVPEWQSASIWFCGPPGFGQALRDDFEAQGVANTEFHQELFQMR